MAKQGWPDVLRVWATRKGLGTGVLVGAHFDVSQSTASRWLSGTGFPEGPNLPRLANELGIEEGRLAQLIYEAKRRSREPRLIEHVPPGETFSSIPLTRSVLVELVGYLTDLAQRPDPLQAEVALDSLAALDEAMRELPASLRRELRRRRAAGPPTEADERLVDDLLDHLTLAAAGALDDTGRAEAERIVTEELDRDERTE